MNFEDLSRELIRELRGQRSQTALSRRLGYRSNVVYRWEAGKRWPNAAEWFRLLVRVQAPIAEALACLGPDLDRRARKGGPPGSHQHLHTLLSSLSDHSANHLASLTGIPAYSVRRMLRGATQPSLPIFLKLVSVATGRLVPFLEALVSPGALSALGPSYLAGVAQREVYSRHRWTEAILAVLECADYLRLPAHSDPWIARQLRIPEQEVRETLQELAEVGGVQLSKGHYRTQEQRATHLSAAEAEVLSRHWARQVVEAAPEESRIGYVLFSCSDEGLTEVRRILRQAFADIRSVVKEQDEPNRVVLMTTSLGALDGKSLPA